MFRVQPTRFDRSHPDNPALRRAVTGLFGYALPTSRFKLGGSRYIYCTGLDAPPPRPVHVERLLPHLLARLIDLIAEYEQSGRFSPIELRTMRRLVFSGWTISKIALVDGVRKQAVSARLYGRRGPNGQRWGGIVQKAPEFVRAWQLIKQYSR